MIAITAVTFLPGNETLFGGMLVISPLTSLFKIICLALAFFTILLTQAEKAPRHPGEYLALVLLATVGLMLLVESEELLMIFIGLELLGLTLYVMAAFDKTDARSAEAGLKYFLFGSTSSAFTLFGISLIYGMSGATGLAAISTKLATTSVQPLLAVGIVMTLVGFAFKIAAAPFHLWAPDAYQGAPVPSAGLHCFGFEGCVVCCAGKIVLIGFSPVQGSAGWHAMVAGWSPVLAALAALSIVIGNLVALAQSNVRRLLAYSAVAHAGYTLIGFVAGDREGFSPPCSTRRLCDHACRRVWRCRRRAARNRRRQFLYFFRARFPFSIARRMHAVFMLSLAGIPPLAGFFGKFYCFSTALHAGANHALLLARRACPRRQFRLAVLLPSRVESDFYRYTVAGGCEPMEHVRSDFLQRATVTLLAAPVVLLGVMPNILASRIFGRDSIRNFKRMQLTLDPRTVSFASKVMFPVAKLVM